MKIPDKLFDIINYYLMVGLCVLVVIMFVSQLFLTESIFAIILLLLMVVLAFVGLAIARKEVDDDK